ncbi:13332_t:CDS:10 [Ambispora gerdemannii]|uniref:13332_t:CDS:1 n=1 Tax=Ambispora gerdemannii TaxID=144530 RepID=A0A9N9GY19_9GLOM|nr:13332_t:CDS:10 [Ambispora gerdemannii]
MIRVSKRIIISEDEEEETISPSQNQENSKPIEVLDPSPKTLPSTLTSVSDPAKLSSDEDTSLYKSKRASKRIIISDTENEESSSTLANDNTQTRKRVKYDYEQRENFRQTVLSPKATRKSTRISKGRIKFNENLRELMENKRQSKLSFKPVNKKEEKNVEDAININLDSDELLSQNESDEEQKEEKSRDESDEELQEKEKSQGESDEEQQKEEESREVEHNNIISSSSNNYENEEFDLDKSAILNRRTREKRSSRYQENLQQLLARRQRPKNKIIELEDNNDEENSDDVDEEETDFEQNYDESDNELNDFIVTGGDTINVSEFDLPERLTSSGSQSLKYHFKVFIQYLTYLATVMNYSDVEETEYFRTSMKMIDRKIQGYYEIIVASSVWNTRFKKCLAFYPSYAVSYTFQAYCDACNSTRSAHYKPLDDSDLLSDDYGSQKSRRGIQKFYLGKFCQIRAKIYHNLQHLKFHFFDKVKGHVNDIIKERGESIDPNNITTIFDENGISENLFRQFEDILNVAEKINLNPNSVEYG